MIVAPLAKVLSTLQCLSLAPAALCTCILTEGQIYQFSLAVLHMLLPIYNELRGTKNLLPARRGEEEEEE